jgi:hypothetical protein
VKTCSRIWGSHGGGCKEFYLLGYNVVQYVETQPTFGNRITSPPSSGMKSKLCLLPASCWFLAWITLQPWRWRRHVPPNPPLTSSELHGTTSQMIEFSLVKTYFITIVIEYMKVACLLPSRCQSLPYEGNNVERKRLRVELIHVHVWAKLTISQGPYFQGKYAFVFTIFPMTRHLGDTGWTDRRVDKLLAIICMDFYYENDDVIAP